MRKVPIWQTGFWLGLAGIWLLMPCIDAGAHNVTVFAWVDGNTVFVESKFSGGRRAKNAPVEVYDSSGNLLITDVTDQQGGYSFTVPSKNGLRIVVLAGMGHKGEWIIPAADLAESASTDAKPPLAAGGSQPAGELALNPSAAADSPPASTEPAGPTAVDIEKAVEKALDKKLAPVMKILAESRKTGPDLRDILGGLGYIVGLVGLAAYLSYRRSKKLTRSPAADNHSPSDTD